MAFRVFFGDADGDDDVDVSDLFAFRPTYLAVDGDDGFDRRFDADADGDVDFADLFRFRRNYQAAPGAAPSLSPVSVAGDAAAPSVVPRVIAADFGEPTPTDPVATAEASDTPVVSTRLYGSIVPDSTVPMPWVPAWGGGESSLWPRVRPWDSTVFQSALLAYTTTGRSIWFQESESQLLPQQSLDLHSF